MQSTCFQLANQGEEMTKWKAMSCEIDNHNAPDRLAINTQLFMFRACGITQERDTNLSGSNAFEIIIAQERDKKTYLDHTVLK
jgi:hypothetical protein